MCVSFSVLRGDVFANKASAKLYKESAEDDDSRGVVTSAPQFCGYATDRTDRKVKKKYKFPSVK